MPDDIYEKTLHVLRLIARTFTQYIGGTCTECIILGTLVTVGATLLNIPYATLVGIIVGVGALVPMFGALIAAIIGALFVATESVQSAVYFMIMFICIQQVEGKLYRSKCSWTFCWLSSNVCNRGSNSRSKFRWYLRNYNFYSCLFMYLSTCQRRCCHAFKS